MKLKNLVGLIPLLYAASAIAIEPFVVKDIRVEGIQRTEAGTVFSYLPVKVGDMLDDEHAAAAIRALFATGFFKDVRLEMQQGVLIVLVRERPSIASIEINGVKDFPKDTLRDNLKSVGLADGRIFDKSALDKAEQELKRQYVARGKYGVKFTTTVTELERNRVAIIFNVVEGETSKIRQINIIGNQTFNEKKLKDLMQLGTPNWISWFTKNDQYSKQKLSADLETLRSLYLDAGYLEFSIDSTQVSITPDKEQIYITINISEGAKYTVSEVKVSGPENILPHAETRKLIKVQAGDVFSRKELTDSTKKIGDRLGEDGYAFANVNAVPDVDKEKHQVGFTFVVDPGARAYVRHIDITGNTKTRDLVIRREFRQMESAWYSASKVKTSKQKVDRLNFFSEVNVETLPVPGTNDQLDVSLAVKEKATGDFSVGAGVSSNVGVVFTGSITQRNLFGTGNSISTQINTSKINQVYSVTYTNPYYTDNGVSRGFDLYKRNVNSTYTAISPYLSATIGGGVRFGVPISDFENTHFGLSAEKTELTLTDASSLQMKEYVRVFGPSTSNLLTSVGWSHDSRDSAIYTTEGTIQRAFVEAALPVSNQRFYKLTYQHQWFYPISQNFTLMLNGEVGGAEGYSGKPVPFFKNFYAGGPGSVRGFKPFSIGPRDINNNSLGGTRRIVGNAELLFPMPGMNKERSVRLSAFVDAGAVFGLGMTGSDSLRYSTGLAVTWVSPMGPLKISIGVPLNKQAGDKLQPFQFTLGSLF
ncbi:Outer membrane protein assembly factor BamA [Candidatus Nitrotoga sp. HW29]|uniref:outer membrane protein assembly factor BamA n=1 Tax=Candidatus Nitrotoga sp. HW29 TaxID=2886963 RepID=UPI001EF30B26|nr:outer membrane protein assembly factor BamA [Candidatus Nitrotoga sp. HW29]CAH1904779.1 Outer membrane protein assembly factor BamA [Candidatus Nitrotoga sp. HW29]